MIKQATETVIKGFLELRKVFKCFKINSNLPGCEYCDRKEKGMSDYKLKTKQNIQEERGEGWKEL